MNTDRIEKSIVLKAPQSRVWAALTDAREFGQWFGCRFEGAFTSGAPITGKITIPNYDHLTMDIVIDRIEPEHYFSYRWHPNACDLDFDYSSEPLTLVEFHLSTVAGGTELRVVETGFDKIPVGRRAEAFKMNEGGWIGQLKNIDTYLAARAAGGAR